MAYTTNFPDYFITDEGTGSLFKTVSAADVKLTSHFDSKLYFVAEQATRLNMSIWNYKEQRVKIAK
jgi:hypothetical protein